MADQDSSALEALLAELEAEDAERHATMAYLRRRLGQPVDNAGGGGGGPVAFTDAAGIGMIYGGGRVASSPGKIRPDEFFRMSIPDAIRRYLAIMKGPQGPKAIADALKDGGLLTNAKDFYGNVWTALKRMEESEAVVNTPKGWGLAEWYPSRPKNDDGKKSKRRAAKKRQTGRKLATIVTPEKAAPRSAYSAFLGKAMKEGKTMQEAAAEWRKHKAEN